MEFAGRCRFSDAIQAAVLADERSQKWIGRQNTEEGHRGAEEDCKCGSLK